MRTESRKLLALILALTVFVGGGFTGSTLQDTEQSTLVLEAGNVPGGAGNTVTNDVHVGIGNAESSGSGTDCTEGSCAIGTAVDVTVPLAAAPRSGT